MSAKFTVIVAFMAAAAGLIFGINRLSTQLHPWGNWLILVVILLVLAAVGAWAWESKEVTYFFTNDDGEGNYVGSWKEAKAAVKREKEQS